MKMIFLYPKQKNVAKLDYGIANGIVFACAEKHNRDNVNWGNDPNNEFINEIIHSHLCYLPVVLSKLSNINLLQIRF